MTYDEYMQACNDEVIRIISERMKSIHGLSHTDAIRLANLSQVEDITAIQNAIAQYSGLSSREIYREIANECRHNDRLAEIYYKSQGKTKDEYLLKAIQDKYNSTMTDGVARMSKGAGFVVNGQFSDTATAYHNAINKSVYATTLGTDNYYSTIRSTVQELSDSGLRVVQYESGRAIRLDSAVRMNVMDGMRQLNMEYRKELGAQFGANGVEITVHALCAPDHLDVQGMQYTDEEFEELQSTLERPIGEMNCMHSFFPIVMGISKPAYSEEELSEIKQNSNAERTYTDKSGNERKCTGYEATQKQRQQEVVLRRLKDQRKAFEYVGDADAVKILDQRIKAQTQYYKAMSNELSLRPKMMRARSFNPNKTQDVFANSRKAVGGTKVQFTTPMSQAPTPTPAPLTHTEVVKGIQDEIVNLQDAIDNASDSNEKLNAMSKLSDAKDRLAKYQKAHRFELYSEEHGVSEEYAKSVRRLVDENVKRVKVNLETPKKEFEIISDIAGADKTKGSCASIGLTYVGKKLGYDVKDFRGGKSREIISRVDVLEGILKNISSNNLKVFTSSMGNQIESGISALSSMEVGKEYYFAVGGHASIVSLSPTGGVSYLELQSRIANMWKTVDMSDVSNLLSTRFGAKTKTKYWSDAWLVDLEDIKKSPEVEDLLTFINTKKPKIGAGGGIK